MRVLFVTQPGDGHLDPLVPIANEARARGHDVAVATSPSFVGDVERAGLPGVGIGPAWRWDSAIELWPDGVRVSGEESPRFWSRRYNRDITIPFVTELRDVVRRRNIDLLVAEWTTAGWCQAGHDLHGTPFVAAGWAIEPGYGLFGLDDIGENSARAALGLDPIEAFEPTWWVLFTPPSWGALDGPPLPNSKRFRLPTLRSGQAVPGATAHPFVYGTLGTVFNTTRSLLKTFIAAIDTGGWAGLVTVGRTNDPSRFDRSPHVAVEQYVPQGDVLAEADVMLCHGGLGSMLGAMAVGCPAVVVPLGGDQLHNAGKAKTLGIARVVDPAEATPDRLRDELALALASEEQRKACEAIRTEVGGMADLAKLVSDFETLIG